MVISFMLVDITVEGCKVAILVVKEDVKMEKALELEAEMAECGKVDEIGEQMLETVGHRTEDL